MTARLLCRHVVSLAMKAQTVVWGVASSQAPVSQLKLESSLIEAASYLRKNDVVAFPTETVYGLGANAYSDDAALKVFAAKGRPSDNPLIVHISNEAQLAELVGTIIPPSARTLMDTFWPGPLTVVLPVVGPVSRYVTAGLSSVGVRMPDHPVALALIELAGVPIAAPSANTSGRPSPTCAQHVMEDLGGKIVGIVDGGETGVGLESTVVDCTGDVPLILRPGGITREQIEETVGRVAVDVSVTTQESKPKAPGMKYAHYAPRAPLVVSHGSREFTLRHVQSLLAEGKKVAVLTTSENASFYGPGISVVTCGTRSDLPSVARSLYDALRSFDSMDVDAIVSESFQTDGIGAAIMNRLNKAAGHNSVRE